MTSNNRDFSSVESYSGSYLKGEQIGPKPKRHTITNCELKTLSDEQGEKVVLTFAEIDEQMVLNKTQFRAITDLFGFDGQNWLGQYILLAGQKLTSGKFAGKWTIAIYQCDDDDDDPAPEAVTDVIAQFWTYQQQNNIDIKTAQEAIAKTGGNWIMALNVLKENEEPF